MKIFPILVQYTAAHYQQPYFILLTMHMARQNQYCHLKQVLHAFASTIEPPDKFDMLV